MGLTQAADTRPGDFQAEIPVRGAFPAGASQTDPRRRPRRRVGPTDGGGRGLQGCSGCAASSGGAFESLPAPKSGDGTGTFTHTRRRDPRQAPGAETPLLPPRGGSGRSPTAVTSSLLAGAGPAGPCARWGRCGAVGRLCGRVCSNL